MIAIRIEARRIPDDGQKFAILLPILNAETEADAAEFYAAAGPFINCEFGRYIVNEPFEILGWKTLVTPDYDDDEPSCS